MGGSIEPPFLLAEEDRTGRTGPPEARYYEITLDSVRQSPVEALNFPQWYPISRAHQPATRSTENRHPIVLRNRYRGHKREL